MSAKPHPHRQLNSNREKFLVKSPIFPTRPLFSISRYLFYQQSLFLILCVLARLERRQRCAHSHSLRPPQLTEGHTSSQPQSERKGLKKSIISRILLAPSFSHLFSLPSLLLLLFTSFTSFHFFSLIFAFSPLKSKKRKERKKKCQLSRIRKTLDFYSGKTGQFNFLHKFW